MKLLGTLQQSHLHPPRPCIRVISQHQQQAVKSATRHVHVAQGLRAARAPQQVQVSRSSCRPATRSAMAPSSATAYEEVAAAGQGKHAVVVGAGPAGALAAMLLAQQGFKVDVFERSAPQLDPSGAARASLGPRSYNILLSERASAAVDQAGADFTGFDVPDVKIALRHKLTGGPAQGRPSMPEGRLKITNRGLLAGALVQQCRARHGDSIAFHFRRALHGLDAAKGTATFQAVADPPQRDGSIGSGSGGVQEQQWCPEQEPTQGGSAAAVEAVQFDLLVGADGARSAVREALVRQDAGLQVRQTRDVMEFKTFVLGPAEQFLPPGSSPVGSFQTWSNSKINGTIIGSSTGNGQLRSVFILPEGVHSTLKTAADYEAYMLENFPSIPEDAVRRAAPQLVDCPPSNGGLITRCSKLHSGRVVLVGDAAHSVYPALGQGANAALEGAAAFARVLQELGPGDIEAVGAEYSRRWLPNALAVAELTEEGFGNNRRAVTFNLKLAQLISQMLLHKVLPFLVPKPIFFELNSTTIPYATVLERSRKEMSVFKGVLGTMAAAAVVVAAWLVRRALS